MSHIPNEPTSESPIPAPEDPLNPPEDHHREPRLDKPAVEPPEEKKSLGRRMSEKLLPVYGPAQITDAKRPITPPTEEEQAREILGKVSWGIRFIELNQEPLDAYAQATDSTDVIRIQGEFF